MSIDVTTTVASCLPTPGGSLLKRGRSGAVAALTVLGCLFAVASSAGPNRWTGAGPAGADVRALAIEPSTQTGVWAGTATVGLFASDDQGASWTWRGPDEAAVTSLAIHPTDPLLVVAATSANGVLKSADGGRSWSQKNSGLPSLDVRVVLIDPIVPQRFWAAGAAGVFRSADGGDSWVPAGAGLPVGLVTALALDPSAPTTLYAGTAAGGVYKTGNGGASWETASVGLGDLRVVTLALNPASPATLYAATPGGLFKSIDGAAGWAAANDGLAEEVVRALVFDPFFGGTVFAGTAGGVFRTTNGGASWSPASGGLGNAAVSALAIDRSLVPTLYAGTTGGVFVSADGGSSWDAGNAGLSGRRISDVAYDATGTGTLLVGTSDGHLLIGTSVPPAWTEDIGFGGASPVSTAVLAGAWYAGTGDGVYCKLDASSPWTALGPSGVAVTAVAVAGTTPKTVYAGTAAGVRTSPDGGATWRAPLLTGLAIRAFAVDSATPTTAFAATSGGVFFTQDSGATWVPRSIGLPTADVTDIAIDPANPLNLWTGTYNAGVFRSANGGANWIAASNGLRGSRVNTLAVDPLNASVIVAGIYGRGVFRSVDDGASWLAVNEELPTPGVWAAAVAPGGGTWIAGTSIGVFTFTVTEPSGNERELAIDTGGWPWTGRAVGSRAGERFVWLNRFSPAAESFPIFLTKVSFVFPRTVSSGRPIELLVMRDPTSGPIYSQKATIEVADGATWNDYTLSQPLLLSSPGDLYVGAVDRGDVTGATLIGHFDDNAPTEFRVWMATYTADPGEPLRWPPDSPTGNTPPVYAFGIRATVVQAAGPAISSISPGGGLTSGGTSVVIRGSNFLGGATVTFGGVAASGVTVLNSGTITALSPPHGAGTVDVQVANADGQSATLAGGFVYFAAPTISLTPATQTIPMGAKGTLSVHLAAPAPVDLTVTLSSSVPWVATVPGFVDIDAGASSATVQVNGIAPGGPILVTAGLAPEAGGAQATAEVTVVARVIVPSVAHNGGMAGSRWFTDLGVVNRGEAAASLTLVYTPKSGAPVTRSHSLSLAGAVEWRNVLETLFGIAAGAESQGVVEITATEEISVSARTYNRSASGTFGQSYPALTINDAIGSGEIAYLPQLKKTPEFRTNVGVVNLGTVACAVRFVFFGAAGAELGEKDISVAPGRWEQQSDVFANIGVGAAEIAYATVDVTTEGGFAWAYASVIDGRTNDPTTVPMLTRSELGPPIGSAVSYTIPSVAHNSGMAGSRWFTDLAVVNTAETSATLSLVYTPRGSGEPVTASVELGPHATVEWRNVLESLFSLSAGTESQGVVRIDSAVLLAVSSRTYNRSATGTFGQSYPALIERAGLEAGVLGSLPGLKKTAEFRTNVGIVNLGFSQCRVRFRIYGATGDQVGETVVTAQVGQWEQVNDVFQVVGAGTQETAYATVEVLSSSGLAWAYASVIDGATNDPTTVVLIR